MEVGGAFLSSFLGVAFDRLASREVMEFFRGRKDSEELCDKLKMLLLSMDPLVTDAELKQIDKPSVRYWLDSVREVVLDADDLFDEIDIQVTQSNLENESQTTNKWVPKIFSSFNLFDNKVKRMNKLISDLEFLQSQKDLLNLKNARGTSGAVVLKKVQSSSHQPDQRYGREDDKENIVNWVISSTDNGDKISIISIVGMGGLGKTTLAQDVYNDPRVKAEFDIHAWVCVSDDFEVLKVTKTILRAITSSADGDTLQDLELVRERLKGKLSGKKLFLVMDDVWNKKLDQWEAVQIPLKYGVAGSKILVTTRSLEVADYCMRSHKTHDLQKLQEEHCWKLFLKHAFNNDNHQLEPNFEKIGRQIVEKCQGLPLAVKTIGSLLYRRSSDSDWKNILKSEIWQLRDSIVVPSLLLSYYHLPSHLKTCFAFCALFPKAFLFVREDLTLLWMAENFLQCSQHNKSMEEVGNEYFDDLLSMSFFQRSNEDANFYVMHDLLNDLAKYVCGDACFRLEVGKKQSIAESTRHFSFERHDMRNFEGFKDLCKASRLRTFLSSSDWYFVPLVFPPHNDLIHDLFSKFRFMRVLSLCRKYDLVEVPDSLGNLKHLRSLDLSHTSIKKLPDSTCSLFNLQILKLKQCRSLKELPLNLHKLAKLCHLDLRGTELRELPMHFPKLKNLQVLTGSFCVDKGGKFKIQQLGELGLYGELLISEMQNIVNPSDALAANFKSKMHLVKLKLEWSENHDDSNQEKAVLEKLQPSKHLEQLEIKNYGGTGFPRWFGDDSLSNMVSLELRNCEHCVFLPSLGVLPSLKKLSIIGLSGIVSVGEEFYGSTSPSFKSLEALSFENMEEWEQWNCKNVTGAFPYLEKLCIKKCPKLKKQLPKQFPCLKKLKISSCKDLVVSLPNAPDIQRLVLLEHGSMLIDYNPSSLKTLEIQSSLTNRKVSTLEKIGFPTDVSLEVLNIRGFSYLNILSLRCCNSLRYLSIKDSCDSLTTFPLYFFPNLHSLNLGGCRNLQMISQEHSHNYLRRLHIWDCPQFESFSSEGLSAPRLERFTMYGLKNLISLPKQMHTLLPSLTQLSIVDCPQVEFISGEGLPSNLTELHLFNCSKLMASLKGALGANISLQS